MVFVVVMILYFLWNYFDTSGKCASEPVVGVALLAPLCIVNSVCNLSSKKEVLTTDLFKKNGLFTTEKVNVM